MKTSRFFSFALLAALANAGTAQNAPETPAPNSAASGASRVVEVDDAALANLPALLGRNGGPAAVSLRASEAAFEADTRAQGALLSYARGGGTVFLHTGAARAFGFATVPARLGSNALAGQLYGRARAALPFGAHPLLWDDGRAISAGRGRAPGFDPTQFPGVNVVFYEMREGDHLVQSHPAGTALLEARDLASNSQTPLYAAALAPFGRGFAVFTPDFIDQNRGDGALFARNLLRLLAPSSAAVTGASASANAMAAGAGLVGVPASAIENGGSAPAALLRALQNAGARAGASPALPAFGTSPAPPVAAPPRVPGEAVMTPPMGAPEMPNAGGAARVDDLAFDATRAEATVLLSRAEAASLARLIAAGGDRAGAAINLLRARLFLGRGETQLALRALDASADLAPDSAEIALWRGILQIGAAQNTNQPSPTRAGLVQSGARDLAQAAGGVSLLGADPGASATLAGLSLSTLRLWSAKLQGIAQVFALEPPLVQRYGAGDGAITVRAFAQDTSLRLIIPGAQALASARNFGWHGDGEEILLFPSTQLYLAYRRALGLSAATVPLPVGVIGDVVGQRASMIALPAAPIVTRNPATGQVRVLATRSGALTVLARLHSYVLLGAYDEGALSPAWLQLGLENIVNLTVGGESQGNESQILEQTVQVGGLLTPDQFRAAVVGGRPEQLALARAQGASLMAFFYRSYGAGAVLETVQRLGAGQNIDEALLATTQGDQTALFENWRDAGFGPRNFPNRGLR